MRAVHGHSASISHGPVVQEEKAFIDVSGDKDLPRLLIHGTKAERLKSILKHGLVPGGNVRRDVTDRHRQHVHLVADMRMVKKTATALIYVQTHSLQQSGIKLWKDSAGCFLTPATIPVHAIKMYRQHPHPEPPPPSPGRPLMPQPAAQIDTCTPDEKDFLQKQLVKFRMAKPKTWMGRAASSRDVA